MSSLGGKCRMPRGKWTQFVKFDLVTGYSGLDQNFFPNKFLSMKLCYNLKSSHRKKTCQNNSFVD